MGIILLKMPQWLISVFNWFTLSPMKKIGNYIQSYSLTLVKI